MKEIFLNGAAFTDNFGDILFFQVFSKVVNDLGYTPSMYSENEKVRAQLSNVSFYSNKLDAIKNADKIAYVGGGYFGEQPNPKWTYRFRWGLQNIRRIQVFGILAIWYKKPIGIFGAGAGNVSNPLTRMVIDKIVNKAEIVIVRDYESKEALKRKKSEAKHIIESVDTILAIDTILNDVHVACEKNILLHLSDSPENDENSKVLWEDVSDFLKENRNFRCTIITDHFSGGQKCSYDYFSNMSKTNSQVSVFKYTDTISLINLIAKSEYVITNKLHVGVVGLSYNKKVISIPNHPKVVNLFKQLGIEERLIRKENLNKGKLLSIMYKIQSEELAIDNKIKERALFNVDSFKEFISKR